MASRHSIEIIPAVQLPTESSNPRERCLILCATQRTGSTMMFDDILNIAGHFGADSEILYSALLRNDPARSYPVPDWETAWKIACEKNRVQNIVALKVMFHYTPYISAAISGTLPARRPPIVAFKPEMFDAFFNFFRDAIWVSVERRDVFAQAVSMYLAVMTRTWEIRRGSASPPAQAPPRVPYDGQKVLRYLRQFVSERTQWRRFFDHYKISPLRLTYDDAVDSYPGYLDEVMAATGLIRRNNLPERRLLKVGDATNEHYARLLRDDVLLELFRRTPESG